MLKMREAGRSKIKTVSPSASAERTALPGETTRNRDYPESELTELLINTQKLYGFLPDDVLLDIAKQLRIPPSRVWSLATFFDMFRFEV